MEQLHLLTSKIPKSKTVLALSLLGLFNIATWVLAYLCFYDSPKKLLFICLMAYGFGLRHAVDCDHIAAIDAVTRKFIYTNKRYIGVGFFFSVGHSTIVVLMSFLVALGTIYMRDHLAGFQEVGGVIGGTVSSLFLLVIALINLVIFIDAYKSFIALRSGKLEDKNIEQLLEKKGAMNTIFKPLFKFVFKSWHMYFIGLLFGLGFDTATEVGLLGISATQAASNMPVWAIMLFPLLFMAGMSLIDTLDGVLMVSVYGWALVRPTRKLYYNMVITLLSFSTAFFIGLMEGLSIICDRFNLHGGIWLYIELVNDNMAYLGYYIIAIFVCCWILSFGISKLLKLKTA